MDALLNWILFTQEGDFTARTVMVIVGAGVWINLMLLATYVPPNGVPVWVALLIILGVGLGAGAIHSAAWGLLIHGAVYICGASGVVMVLLIGVVGTPKRISERYTAPIDRGRWWILNVLRPVANIKERVSNWGDLPSAGKPRKRGRRD
jgi:hypothetical protein